jgi:hypothetical protein
VGWLLTGKREDRDAVFDEFFLVIGRALYIATGFEMKCRYILRLWRLLEEVRETGDFSASLELVAKLKGRTLGRTIDGLRGVEGVKPEDIPVLERARDARNFIAHESADVGRLYMLSPRKMEQRLGELRAQLDALAPGDDLVSRWVYEIEEKEPAPRWLMPDYASLMQRWVFGEREGA